MQFSSQGKSIILPQADGLFGSAGEGQAEAAGEVLEALDALDEVGFLWCFHAPLKPFEGRRRDRDSEDSRKRAGRERDVAVPAPPWLVGEAVRAVIVVTSVRPLHPRTGPRQPTADQML